jgi:hypothetical protein
MSLFITATTSGWAEFMYRGAAGIGIDLQPVKFSLPYNTFYFLAFITVGSFFVLNLFIGVIISTYQRNKEMYGRNFMLTDKQKQWIETKIMIIQARPIIKMQMPNYELRQPFFSLVENKWFDKFIFLCIILNTIVLAIDWHGAPEQIDSITTQINYIFAAIYTLETISKLIGYGARFFKDPWNIFDFVIVILTNTGIVLALTINV